MKLNEFKDLADIQQIVEQYGTPTMHMTLEEIQSVLQKETAFRFICDEMYREKASSNTVDLPEMHERLSRLTKGRPRMCKVIAAVLMKSGITRDILDVMDESDLAYAFCHLALPSPEELLAIGPFLH